MLRCHDAACEEECCCDAPIRPSSTLESNRICLTDQLLTILLY